jgi:hypothetical protein
MGYNTFHINIPIINKEKVRAPRIHRSPISDQPLEEKERILRVQTGA